MKHKGIEMDSVELTDELLKTADVVVIATNHTVYDAAHIVETSKLVFDTRNLTKGIEAENLERL